MKKHKLVTLLGIISVLCCIFFGCGTVQQSPSEPTEEKEMEYDMPETGDNNTEYLFYEGKSSYRIVISQNAMKAEKTAAEELQKYLNEITGFRMKIVTDTEAEPKDTEIILGHTNRDTEDVITAREGLGEEGYTVLYLDKKIYITGGDEETLTYGRGTLYGTYDFLRLLGCGFYSADTEIIPKKSEITVEKTAVREVPAFEYRDVFWSCAYDEVLSAKLHLNGGAMSGTDGRTVSPEYGGAVSYAGPKFVHTFTYLISADEYFTEHPEYFSMINGKRTGKNLYSQLCLTNEDVFQIVLTKVKEWLRANPEARIVTVSQNDSFVIESYCTCSKCSKIDSEEGSHMGALLRFVNRLAEELEKEFPDVAVDTLAYQYSLAVPKVTKPRHNVIIRYCTGGCSLHAISKCTSNTGIKSNIKAWGKICDRMYIWDYTTDFAEYLCPFINFYSLQPNLKFFRDNGVKGVFEQGMYQTGESGEFGELRSYLLARLLWNPDLDLDALIDEFMEAYYGDAGKYIKQYIETLHEALVNKRVHMNLVVTANSLYGFLKQDVLDRLEGFWNDAKNASKGDPVKYSHVERSELSYRFLKQQLGAFEFAANKDAEGKKFLDDCRRLGVVMLNEGTNIGNS